MPLPTAASPAEQRRRALEILDSADPEHGLLELVAWLDHELCAEQDEDYSSLPWQLYLRALLALGYLLIGQKLVASQSPVGETIVVAQDMLHDPTERMADALFAAATMSYPFGPGDGCFAVPDLGAEGCERGSGCSSGVGGLALQGLPRPLVFARIRDEVRPWLQHPEYDYAVLRPGMLGR